MDSWVEYVICPNIGHGNTGTRTRGGGITVGKTNVVNTIIIVVNMTWVTWT